MDKKSVRIIVALGLAVALVVGVVAIFLVGGFLPLASIGYSCSPEGSYTCDTSTKNELLVCSNGKWQHDTYCYYNGKSTWCACDECTTTPITESKPPCDGAVCTDTDGGKDYYKKGTATDATRSVTDSCSGDYVLEQYCRFDRVESVGFYCQYGCSDGACISTPPPTECTDTDGQDYYTKGTVTDKDGKTGTDYCSGDYVVEYLCGRNDELAQIAFLCGYGCSDGACASTPPDCQPGELKYYTCPDGAQVQWCHCENEEWACIISPETQCPSYICSTQDCPLPFYHCINNECVLNVTTIIAVVAVIIIVVALFAALMFRRK